MAFGLEKNILTEQLKKIGASVVANDQSHTLIVNDKYKISYTNSYYGYKDSESSMGRGIQKFLKLIESEMKSK